MSDQLRSEWRNVSDGIIGVTIYDEDNKRRGIAVRPGDSILLTERDRIATANAPTLERDNPLTNGTLQCITASSEIANRRSIGTEGDTPAAAVGDDMVEVKINGVPIRMTRESASALQAAQNAQSDIPPEGTPPRIERDIAKEAEETAGPPAPGGDPEVGVRAPGEEVGTPDAVAQAGTAKRKGGRGVTVKSASPVEVKPVEGPVGVKVGSNGPEYATAP